MAWCRPATSHYLNQWWLDHWRIYASLGLNELTDEPSSVSGFISTSLLLQSNAIYQAKQKLTAIGQANKRRISSEELIKYAHKISASNAVAAPPTWCQGKLLNFK